MAGETLVCRVELQKSGGVTLTVDNGRAGIVQTIKMNGTTIETTNQSGEGTSIVIQTTDSITTEVKGAKTSTVTQDQHAVKVHAQTFEVEAESIKMTSAKNIEHSAQGRYVVSSAEDMSFGTKSKYALTCDGPMTHKSLANVTMQATSNIKVAGRNITVAGSGSTVVEGGSQAKVLGSKVAMLGTAQAELAAPQTTVGKDLTTIKGTPVVKLDAPMIKLG